jgi:nitrate/nitrite transporter NarK
VRDHQHGYVDDRDRICGAQLSRQIRRADLVAATGGPHLALEIFLIFYVTCIAMTWWFYLRKSFMAKQAPSSAETRV